MKAEKAVLLFSVLAVCCMTGTIDKAFAQGEYSSGVNPVRGIKQEVSPDRKQFKDGLGMHKEHRENIRGRIEEKKDKREDFKDRREDFRDKKEDFRDRREDIRDRREDIRDRREDIKDRKEDFRDRREDFKDRREDFRDKREDFRDKKEGFRERRENLSERKEKIQPKEDLAEHQNHGVRDHGKGIGAGKGQGGLHRSAAGQSHAGPKEGGRRR